MKAMRQRSIISCQECGCEAVLMVGRTTQRSRVRCRVCWTDAGSWPEWLDEVTRRVEAGQTGPFPVRNFHWATMH